MKISILKNKIFAFCLAFALIIPAIFLLSACGEENYYFTITTPEHCSFSAFSFATDKDGKSFVNKGSAFEGSATIEPGYEVQGELTLKINGENVNWTNTEGNYYISFVPTEDFNIVIEGTIIESTYQITFDKSEYIEDSDLSNLYIRFGDQSEQTLNMFLNSNNTKFYKYDDYLEFWVYTKGYYGEPSIIETNSMLNKTFYKDEANNQYGYHYFGTIEANCSFEFSGITPIQVYIITSIGASSSEIISSHSPFTNEHLTISIDETFTTLTIILNNDMTTDIVSSLTLKINGEIQESLSSGTNVIALKPAYKYNNAEKPYQYEIDLNYYEFY